MRIHPGVTVLFLGVLSTTGMHLLRIVAILTHWNFLETLLGNQVIYILISGIVLFFVGMISLVLVWRRSKITRPFLAGYVLLITVVYWIERLMLQADYRRENLIFTILFQLSLLAIFMALLNRQSTKIYFGVQHDGKSED